MELYKNGDIACKWHYSTGCKISVTLIEATPTPYGICTMLSRIPSIRAGREANIAGNGLCQHIPKEWRGSTGGASSTWKWSRVEIC